MKYTKYETKKGETSIVKNFHKPAKRPEKRPKKLTKKQRWESALIACRNIDAIAQMGGWEYIPEWAKDIYGQTILEANKAVYGRPKQKLCG